MKALPILWLLLQVVQTTPPADQLRATVRGHVFALDNGAPLKRAQVTLRGNQRQSDPQSTMTDAQGAYEFRNVDPGNYNVFASKSGYIAAGVGQGGPQRPGSQISARAGQDVKDVDIRLMRGGGISGVVTDEDGEPMANVAVQAMVRTYRRGQSTINGRGGANTDDRGQYRIYGLPPGRYYVQAVQRGVFAVPGRDEMVGYAPTFYPNALTLQDGQRVDLTSGGEVSRIDMVIRSVPTVTVSGRVIDGFTGHPAGEGYVSIVGADMMRGGGGGSGAQIRGDGTFRISGVLPGKSRLMVSAERGGGYGPRPFSRLIDVGSSSISDLQIVVSPGVTVRGKVVADGGNVPLNLRLSLAARGEAFGGPGFGGGVTALNNDLTFEVENVQPGDYDINVGGPNAAFYVREVRKGTENVLEHGLTVADGSPVNDVEVVLDFQPGALAGKAVDENGEQISGATVVLVSADAKYRALDRYFRTGSVDSNGNYKVSGVVPGSYLAFLWPGTDPYQLQDPDVFGPLEKHATRVSVEKGATATQDLRIASQVKAAAQSFGQ